jgi:hypothetical protein
MLLGSNRSMRAWQRLKSCWEGQQVRKDRKAHPDPRDLLDLKGFPGRLVHKGHKAPSVRQAQLAPLALPDPLALKDLQAVPHLHPLHPLHPHRRGQGSCSLP